MKEQIIGDFTEIMPDVTTHDTAVQKIEMPGKLKIYNSNHELISLIFRKCEYDFAIFRFNNAVHIEEHETRNISCHNL